MALAIVLITLVALTLGPNIINAMSEDNEELMLKVERQRSEIQNLNGMIGELNAKILNNQMACTEKFVTREQEILEMIIRMESEAKRLNGRVIQTEFTSEVTSNMMRMDIEETEGELASESAPMVMEVPIQTKTVTKVDNSKIIGMLEKMKKSIQKTIQEEQD